MSSMLAAQRSAVQRAVECRQKWAIPHIELRAKFAKEGQRSLHLASGHSVLPVADAMLGMQVLATDIDAKTVNRLLDMLPVLAGSPIDFCGSLDVKEIDIFSDFFRGFRGETFDFITLTDFFKIQLFSYFPYESLVRNAEYTIFQVLNLLPQRGFLTITEDKMDLCRGCFSLVEILNSFLFSAISCRVIGTGLPTSDRLNDAYMYEITKTDRFNGYMKGLRKRYTY